MRSGSKVSGKELLQSPERHGPARPDGGRAGRRVTKLLCNDGKQNPDNSCMGQSAAEMNVTAFEVTASQNMVFYWDYDDRFKPSTL